MSLAIDVDRVVSVLLADGWHVVYDRSFGIDAYEYVWGDEVLLGGGQCPPVPSAGASWCEMVNEREWVLYVPLTAVLAVKTKRREKK